MGFVQPRNRFYVIGNKKKNIRIKVDRIINEREIYKSMKFEYVPPTDYDIKLLRENIDKIKDIVYVNEKSPLFWRELGGRKNIPTITSGHSIVEINRYGYSRCPQKIGALSAAMPTCVSQKPILKYTYSGTKIEFEKNRLQKKLPVVIKKHPIMEIDGISMRILPPEEHEFLQGFPIGYTAGFSKSRRIAMIGNSWHVGCVAEIFRQMFKGGE